MKGSFHRSCCFAVDINCEVTSGFYSIRCISRRPGSLRVDAFHGHGLSLLALAKGMSTLFAKNGFSRPSFKQFCGVFGHVLFPQMFSVGRVIAVPGVTTLHLPGLMKWLDANFCPGTTIANGSKCRTSGGNTRRLLGEKRHRRDPAVR